MNVIFPDLDKLVNDLFNERRVVKFVELPNEKYSFPPFNILKSIDGNSYKIELALAGYNKDDVSITNERNVLTVEGKPKTFNSTNWTFEQQGIAHRKFVRRFTLGEYVQIKEAVFEDGLLTINLEIVLPDDKKPRKIEINTRQPKQLLVE